MSQKVLQIFHLRNQTHIVHHHSVRIYDPNKKNIPHYTERDL